MPIINLTRETTIAKHVEIASNPLERMKGLLGRNTLDTDQALIIPFCNSIHMFFMKFPIDVIFLDKTNRVVGLTVNIKPFELSPIFWKSSCAIELPAGTIELTQTQQGDQFSMDTAG